MMDFIAPYSEILIHENMVVNMLDPNVSKVVGISFSIWVEVNVLMQMVSVLYVLDVGPYYYNSAKEGEDEISHKVLLLFFHLIS